MRRPLSRSTQPRVNRRSLGVESLESRALMATLIWDGNGGNGQNTDWLAWNNWNLNRIPQSGDELVFAGTRKLSNYNDVRGLSIPSISIQSNGFHIDGEGITVGAGGLSFVGGSTATWGIPLTLTEAATPLEVSGSRVLNLTDAFLGAGGLVKTGAGTAQLYAGGSFTGTTRVAGGDLRVNASEALANSAVDYNNYGGSISFGVSAATFGGLSGGQSLPLVTTAGGPVALTVGGDNRNTEYSGVLGGGSLTKVGSGRLSLSGDSSLTAVTVTGGKLSGGGSARSLRLDGGTLAPGDGIGAITFQLGAAFAAGVVELELTDARSADQIRVAAGDVTLGAELRLLPGPDFELQPGESITLLNNLGAGSTSGVFSNSAALTEIVINGVKYQLRSSVAADADGIANDVVLERPLPDAPVAAADEFFVNEDEPLTFTGADLLENDEHTEGVAFTIVQPPRHGSLTAGDDGSWTYTPDDDFHGLDELIYQIANDTGGVSQAAVRIEVVSVNDVPVVTGPSRFTAVETDVLEGRLTATDVEGDALAFRAVDGLAIGAVTLAADGSFRYNPGSVPATDTVSFTYAVSDGADETLGTATIKVFDWNGKGIRPDVLEWILANNPGLPANFLRAEPPDRAIKLPDGRTVQIYLLDQFLDVNFRWNFSSRVKGKVDFVERQELHLRKLMARPEFYRYILSYRGNYKIGGLGTVSAERAYRFIRDVNQRIWVTADPRIKAPVGGGNGINGPSWAVWNQLNLFFHEACHVVGIGHNSGGLSGPLAGKLRDWDRPAMWDYQTIDLNSLRVPPT